MVFGKLSDIEKLKLKKICRVNEELKGWLPSDDDHVIFKNGQLDALFSENLEIEFENNNIKSVNRF
jgi:hypothetical protein